MGEPKPLASLSGLLLARKGAARPAMRRPSPDGGDGKLAINDDLGWNDMGYDVDPDQNTPMDHEHDVARNPLANAVPEVKPDVRAQQAMIAKQLEEQAEVGFESVPSLAHNEAVETPVVQAEDAQSDNVNSGIVNREVPHQAARTPAVMVAPLAPTIKPKPQPKPQPKQRAAAGSKAKAAFTLRLDKDRHLKLRLACAVNNRSAQMLVTDALDAFLENMPDISQLAAQVPVKNIV